MSKKGFPLATVLRVRGIEEQIARGQVAGALAAEALAVRVTELAAGAYGAAPDPTGQAPVATFLAERLSRTALARGVRDAGARQVAASEVVLGAREDWSAAAMRLTALERLAERAHEARRQELLAGDQRTAEETAAAVLAGRRTS